MIQPVTILLMIFLACQPLPVAAPLTFEQRWEPVTQIPPPRELTFEERWEPVRRMPPMIQMNELPPRVVPVRTITIRAEPAVYIEPAEQVASAEPMPRPRPVVRSKVIFRSTNVCRRHGMTKQITRGGKSWRCRR